MVGRPYLYKLYDLAIQSEFELADLSILDADAAIASSFPIVEIVSGKVPESLPNGISFGWIEASPSSCIFHIRDKCRLQVSNGNQIILQTFPTITNQEICAYIVGCGFPALAHMRRMIPLHVSMVNSPYGAIMFTGGSGAGKSTTAAALEKQLGWALLCDDICVLQPSESGGKLHFGVNKIKLWENSISELEITSLAMQRDHVRPEKFHIAIEPADSIEVSNLSVIFRLRWADHHSLTWQNGSIIFESLMNSVHGDFLVKIYDNLSIIQQFSLKTANKTRGLDFARCRTDNSIKHLAKTIDDILKKGLT